MPAVDDLKSLDRLDQVVLGAGVLGLIVSFFPFYGASYNFAGIHESSSVSAWHSYGVLGVLLVLVGTGLAAARIFAPTSIPKMAIGTNLLIFVLVTLGTLVLILRGFTYQHASGSGGSVGVRWGGYLLFIILIVESVAAFLLFRKSGEAMPDFSAMNANRAANTGAGTAPVVPPAATYPPSTTPTATPAGDYTLDDSAPPPAP